MNALKNPREDTKVLELEELVLRVGGQFSSLLKVEGKPIDFLVVMGT